MKTTRLLLALIITSTVLPSAFAFNAQQDPQLNSPDPYNNYNLAPTVEQEQASSHHQGHVYVQAGGGLAISRLQNANTILAGTRFAASTTNTKPVLSLGLGYRWQVAQNWLLDTGLSYYHFSTQSVKGRSRPVNHWVIPINSMSVRKHYLQS